MAATERVVVLMTEEQKASVVERAGREVVAERVHEATGARIIRIETFIDIGRELAGRRELPPPSDP